jgi:hypothetical protein
MIKQWKQDYNWAQGGVFTAISKKDELYVKLIGPYLKGKEAARAWYLIQLTEDGACLIITLKDDTEESTRNH